MRDLAGSQLPVRFLLLFCVVVWGWTFVATKICLGYVGPFELVGLRFSIGLPVLLVIVLIRRVRFDFGRASVRGLALGAAIIAAHFLIQAEALLHTSATHTGWIIAVAPLAIATLSWVLLREPVGPRAWAGIVLASLGIIVLVSKGRPGNIGWLENLGDWLVLLSAHTWALYTIATRNLSRSHDPLAVTVVVYAPLTLICLARIAVTSRLAALLSLPPRPAASLLLLGVLGTAAQWFWQEGVGRLGAVRAGMFLYLEPLATTALAVPLLGESYGAATALGGAMILAGVWWSQR